MGIFDFFERKTDVEEYYEERDKKNREKYNNFSKPRETAGENTRFSGTAKTDKTGKSFSWPKLIVFLIMAGTAVFLLNTFRYKDYYDEDYEFVLEEQGKIYRLNNEIIMAKDKLTGGMYINASELWKIFKLEEFEYKITGNKSLKWEDPEEKSTIVRVGNNKKKVTIDYINKGKILYTTQKTFSVWVCSRLMNSYHCGMRKIRGVSYNELKKELNMKLDIKVDEKKKIIYFIKKDRRTLKKINRENEKEEKDKKEAEEKKYNRYIGLYERLEDFYNDFDYYFSGAGREEKFVNKYERVRFRLSQEYVNNLKNIIKEKPEIPEADIAADDLVLVLNELLILFEKTDNYYKKAEYSNDGYEGAQILHTEILEGSKRYESAVCNFRMVLEKNGMEAETESQATADKNMERAKLNCGINKEKYQI